MNGCHWNRKVEWIGESSMNQCRGCRRDLKEVNSNIRNHTIKIVFNICDFHFSRPYCDRCTTECVESKLIKLSELLKLSQRNDQMSEAP